MHVYMMKNQAQIPIFLTLECVEMGATIDNIIAIILQTLIKFVGLVENQITTWWVCFGCDDDYVFQGHHTSVIT